MRYHWKLGFFSVVLKKWQQRASLQCARFFFLCERISPLLCLHSHCETCSTFCGKKNFKYQFYYIGNVGWNLSPKNHCVSSWFLWRCWNFDIFLHFHPQAVKNCILPFAFSFRLLLFLLRPFNLLADYYENTFRQVILLYSQMRKIAWQEFII